jgi:hypothetical protein
MNVQGMTYDLSLGVVSLSTNLLGSSSLLRCNLGFGVVCLAGFNLSTWSDGGQKSIILIFLDLLFGQGTASSLSSFGLLGCNLLGFYFSFV